jgi:hypothetical protein
MKQFYAKAVFSLRATVNAGNIAFRLSPISSYYRVSIKSFPDYKHLLQEDYVEYKHIFYLF